jgi:hypothetical protein
MNHGIHMPGFRRGLSPLLGQSPQTKGHSRNGYVIYEERRFLQMYVIYCHHATFQYNNTNVMHFLFSLLRINASTCFEHCFLILRRRFTSALGVLRCVLRLLAATRIGVEQCSKNVKVLINS